jgi:IS30 family transposase
MFKSTMDPTDKILHDAYYNVGSPSCYSNAVFVLREARKKNNKITIEQVKDFLSKQDVYTLHHRYRKNYRRNATIAAGLDMHWQADLADMLQYRRENAGNSYLLICVDVFSRYAFVRCLKSKTAQEVGEAFQDIITTTHRRPFNLMTDKGSEF